MPPVAMAPQAIAPVKNKTSPLVWILVAIGGLFLLVAVAAIGGGFFLVHKAKQAGLDPELWQKNPGLAASKMIAAVNPDVQVVHVDDSRGVITLRDTKTGKTVTMNFDDVKNGRFRFHEEGQPEVSMETKSSGNSGSLTVKGSNGETMEFGSGAAAKIPSWVPGYPGAKPEGTFSAHAESGEGGMFTFKTGDGNKKVLSWYEDSLKGAGFKITVNMTTDQGGMLGAEDSSKHTVMVTLGNEQNQTAVQVTYGTKK